MKKNFTLFAVLALALAGCAKEASVQDTFTPAETVAAGKVVYTLTANLPETKVTADRTGVFAWEGNETIAVWDEVSGKFIEFNNSAAEKSTFTATLDEGTSYNFSIAYYPATIVGSAKNEIEYPASYNSIDDIKPIMAAKVNSNSLAFTQLGALMHITINDVPSIAGKILIEPNKSGAYFKGKYTVNTDDLTISSISGNSDAVTIMGISGGKNEFYLPVPPGTYKTGVRISDAGSNIWFFDSGIGTERTLAQNDLINMKPISINPTVYLKSDMTDWDVTDSGWEMGKSGTTYSTSINSIGTQYFTVYVKYPASDIMKMGPESDGTTSSNVELKANYSTAVKLADRGAYTITFNPTTSVLSYEKTSADLNFYLVGSENNWNITDTSIPLANKDYDGKYYIIGQKGKFKIRYNETWGSTIGNPANSSDSYNFGASDDASSSLIIDIPTDGTSAIFNFFNEDYQSSASNENVYLKINNAHDGFAMSQDAYNKSLWTYEYTSESTHYVTFWVDYLVGDGSLWGTDSSLSTTEYNGVGASYNRYYDVDNWCISAMKYLIVLNDKTGKVKFLRLE